MSDKPQMIRPRNTMLERLGGRPGVPGKVDASLLKKAEDVLKFDTRPPVLYLRSFQDDPVGDMLPDEALLNAQSKAVQSLFVGTEEQQVADVFGRLATRATISPSPSRVW